MVAGKESRVILGVIGGSGLYEMEGFSVREEVRVETPFGAPSDALIIGDLESVPTAFLARHGRGHRILPTEINFRANIFAMKSLGVQQIISASAVGSLREHVHPLDVVVPDQFIDRTRHRVDTFFGEGIVGHVSLADPFCASLSATLTKALRDADATVHVGGTYVCMEGPQFSTRAESEMYRTWNGTVIGMTNLQEARLAREAEICYATMAMVTDYDCWHGEEDDVTVEAIIERLSTNAALARRVVRSAAGALSKREPCACGRALDDAIITPQHLIPEETRSRLGAIIGRVLEGKD